MVLLVHRPRYDDWSLPKGKLLIGESARNAALREVQEETGMRCALGSKLGEVRYRDHKDRPKRVRYWSMQAIEGGFAPNDEVDAIRWVQIDRAGSALSYSHDAAVVARFSRRRSAA